MSERTTTPSPAEPPDAAPDGRHLRSERTKVAIVDALLALLDEGDVAPSTERIAARAGVSRRAIFNHFPDTEGLLAAAADRQMGRVLPMLRPIAPDGPLAVRVTAYAAQVSRLHGRVAPVRRAALLAERSSPVVAARLVAARAVHRASIERVFARELEPERGVDRDDLVAALVAATSFSAWEELVTHQKLSRAAAERVVRRSLAALLEGTRRSTKEGS